MSLKFQDDDCQGVKTGTLNGKTLPDNFIPANKLSRNNRVKILLGLRWCPFILSTEVLKPPTTDSIRRSLSELIRMVQLQEPLQPERASGVEAIRKGEPPTYWLCRLSAVILFSWGETMNDVENVQEALESLRG